MVECRQNEIVSQWRWMNSGAIDPHDAISNSFSAACTSDKSIHIFKYIGDDRDICIHKRKVPQKVNVSWLHLGFTHLNSMSITLAIHTRLSFNDFAQQMTSFLIVIIDIFFCAHTHTYTNTYIPWCYLLRAELIHHFHTLSFEWAHFYCNRWLNNETLSMFIQFAAFLPPCVLRSSFSSSCSWPFWAFRVHLTGTTYVYRFY